MPIVQSNASHSMTFDNRSSTANDQPMYKISLWNKGFSRYWADTNLTVYRIAVAR